MTVSRLVVSPISSGRIALRCKRFRSVCESPVVEIMCGRSVSGVSLTRLVQTMARSCPLPWTLCPGLASACR